VNFRRVVGRGLVNCLGERWYREGLPGEVFRRLVARKENETPLDRFSGDYEELLTYTSFRDLAEIIAANEALADRLRILEPRDGASLQDRLHELDELRRSITAENPASGQDLEKLKRYHADFRAALKGGKKRKIASQAPPPPQRPVKPPGPKVEPGEETLESLFGDESGAHAAPGAESGKVDLKVWAEELKSVATEPTPTEVTDVTDLSVPFPVEGGGESPPTPVVRVSTPGRGTPPPLGPLDDIEVVESAIADGNDQAVLKALHMEVTEIADGMLRHQPRCPQVVWHAVERTGWYEAKRDGFGLEPLETFYSLAEIYAQAQEAGSKKSELKNVLSEAGFSKLLLAMREVFLNSRVRG
jgi:hypothetical protein